MPPEPDELVSEGLAEAIPPVQPPKKRWSLLERDERKQFEKDGAQTHNIRRLSAYGALLLATGLYAAGLYAVAVFIGLIPGHSRVDGSMWHIVVATLAALFTVPTVLTLAVLKLAGADKPRDDMPRSVQEALGKMIEKFFDKIAS